MSFTICCAKCDDSGEWLLLGRRVGESKLTQMYLHADDNIEVAVDLILLSLVTLLVQIIFAGFVLIRTFRAQPCGHYIPQSEALPSNGAASEALDMHINEGLSITDAPGAGDADKYLPPGPTSRISPVPLVREWNHRSID